MTIRYARPTVMLACAGADAPALAVVVRRLAVLGCHVEVVPEVDLDVGPVRLACARAHEATWWVLCRTDELDDFQIDLLAAVLVADGRPASRVRTLDLDHARPERIVDEARRWLRATGAWPEPQSRPRAARAAEPAKPPARRTQSLAQRDPSPRSTTAVVAPKVRPVARRRATLHVSVPVMPAVAPAPVMTKPAAPVVAKPMAPPVAAKPVAPVVTKPMAPPVVAKPVAPPVPQVQPVVAFVDEPVASPIEPVARPRDPEPVVAPVEPSATLALVPPSVAPRRMPPAPHPVTTTGSWVAAPRVLPEHEDDTNHRLRRARRFAGVMATLSIAAAIAVTWVRMDPSPSTDEPSITLVAAVPAVSSPAGDHEPAAVATSPGTRASASNDTAGHVTRPRPMPIPQLADTPLGSALQQRDVRAIDDLLVAPLEAEGIDRRHSAQACRDLSRGGIDQWRLPKVGEVRRLVAAGFVRSGERVWVDAGPRKPAKRASVGSHGTRAHRVGPFVRADAVCVTEAAEAAT